ncbi:unnamed protein product [Rotaria socialis]
MVNYNSIYRQADAPNDDSMLSQFYFHNKFGTTNRTTTLAGDVQTQFTGINKQPRYLSKAVHDQSLDPNLAPYQNLAHKFPRQWRIFRGLNLLTIAQTANSKKYARIILKTLFTSDELSDSILFANPNYTRPGLDPKRMATFTDAICARFKIDPDYFTEFFRTCLRRTLPQTICDVRRTRRRSAVRVIAGGNVDGNRGNGYFGNIGVANAAASPFQSTSHSLTGDDP